MHSTIQCNDAPFPLFPSYYPFASLSVCSRSHTGKHRETASSARRDGVGEIEAESSELSDKAKNEADIEIEEAEIPTDTRIHCSLDGSRKS